MSHFFSNPLFIAATHDERVRRLRGSRSATPRRTPPARRPARQPTSDGTAAEFSMQVQPIINAVQAALASQGSLAGGDVAVEEAIDHLVSALAPGHPPGGDGSRRAGGVRGSGAAARPHGRPRPLRRRSIAADRRVGRRRQSPNSSEDLDARITLRVPPSLKCLVEDAAETAGASVNSWILDALSRRARKPQQSVRGSARHTVSTCRKTR